MTSCQCISKRPSRTKAERSWSLVEPIRGGLPVLQDTKQHLSASQCACQDKGGTLHSGRHGPTSKPK